MTEHTVVAGDSLWSIAEARLATSGKVEVFEVPLAFLMNPANHRRHALKFEGIARRFISMPWGADAAGEPYFIWGATAAMLRNLYRFLAR